MEATAGGVPWWLSGFKGTLLRALANVSVTISNVVVKYLAPCSVATLTCTRLATFTAELNDHAISEVRLLASCRHQLIDLITRDFGHHINTCLSSSCLQHMSCWVVSRRRACESAGIGLL